MSKVLSLLYNYLYLDIVKLIISYCWKKGYPHCLHDGNYEEYFDTLFKNNIKVSVLEFESACLHNYQGIIEKMFQVGFQQHPVYYLYYACIYGDDNYVDKLIKLNNKQSKKSLKNSDCVKLYMIWYKSLMLACKTGNLNIVKLLRPSMINDINNGILIAKKYTKNNYKEVIEYLKRCKVNEPSRIINNNVN